MDDAKILAPVRYSAWLSGDLGRELTRQLEHAVGGLAQARVTRLARGFLVEADEDAGPLLEAVAHAMRDLERGVAARYPVFHQEMGPVWTGTLQAVFCAGERPAPSPGRCVPAPSVAPPLAPAA
jgi:hypothetical protein